MIAAPIDPTFLKVCAEYEDAFKGLLPVSYFETCEAVVDGTMSVEDGIRVVRALIDAL